MSGYAEEGGLSEGPSQTYPLTIRLTIRQNLSQGQQGSHKTTPLYLALKTTVPIPHVALSLPWASPSKSSQYRFLAASDTAGYWSGE